MFVLIHEDGLIEIVRMEATLKNLQKAVGGLIYPIEMGSFLMLVDEEGILKRRPINKKAGRLVNSLIVGKVLIAKDGGEEIRGLTKEELEQFKTYATKCFENM